jgi:hypothetical protein
LSRLYKIYYYLGLSAVIATVTAPISSLIVYIRYDLINYLYYAIMWGLIALIDYIVWRRPPKTSGGKGLSEDTKCDYLRESAELIAILNYLSSHRDEYGVAWRLDSLLNKVDSLLEVIHSCCSEETYYSFNNAMNNPEDEDIVSKAIRLLHECMLNNGCESNVSISDEE